MSGASTVTLQNGVKHISDWKNLRNLQALCTPKILKKIFAKENKRFSPTGGRGKNDYSRKNIGTPVKFIDFSNEHSMNNSKFGIKK